MSREYKDKVFVRDYDSRKKGIKEFKMKNQALCGELMVEMGENMNVKVRGDKGFAAA
jgi:hypothetical protein